MKNIIRFALAVVLAVVMVFASSPVEAASYLVKDMAEGTWTGEGGARWIAFGRWNGRPIVWRILDVHPDSQGRKVAFLLSEEAIDIQPYSISNKSGWKDSDINKWLNNEFFNRAFHDSEKYCILYSKYIVNEKHGEEDEVDSSRVFLLSAEEVQHKKYFADDEDRVLDGFQQTWWLRSSGGDNSTSCVFHNGAVISCDAGLWKAVRPAMTIDLSRLSKYRFTLAPLPQPEVIAAVETAFIEELPIDGALIYEENVLYAPRDGVLTYKMMQSPSRVERGYVIAEMSSVEIRAEEPGYFAPFLDGNEGKYTYDNLWSGRIRLPQAEPPHIQYHGARLLDEPIGKLIPMPQPLRCVAFIDKTAPLMEQVKSNKFLNLRTQNTIWRAEILKYIDLETKIKVYMTLPFFPASAIISRKLSANVYLGRRQGVSVPASTVTAQDGKLGVLLTHGERKGFVGVEGFPIDNEFYFISEGLMPGDVVVLNADREGYLLR